MKRRKMLQYAAITPIMASAPTNLAIGKTKKRNVLIEAHRGNSVSAPENTLIAIDQALKIGVDRIEIDLQLTKDKKLAVIHDDTLDRTTDGSGMVSDHTWDEIRNLDAGSWKDARFKSVRIPLLEDVFDLCKGKSMVNIDLKNPYAVPFMVSVILDMNMEEDVVITGKVPQCANSIREAGASLTMFYESSPTFSSLRSEGKVLEAIKFAVKDVRKFGLPGFLFHSNWVNDEVVYIAHLHGLAVNVYDVNTTVILKKMLNAGVDGIMTDDPLLVKETKTI